MSTPDEVTAQQAHDAVGGGAMLIDVRERWEWDEQRIPGAVHIPLGELEDRVDEVPADRDVYVHCRHGARSARAVELLRAHGRNRTTNVAGGIDAWSKAGLPTEGDG